MTQVDLIAPPEREPKETGYRCILADPPWQERGGGKVKRGADKHYPLMSTPDIIRTIVSAPQWRPAASAHLWLWVTDNFLEDGLLVMNALGFSYRRTLAWVKFRDYRLQIGLGQYLRGAHELCLLGTRGAAAVPSTEDRSASVILAPRTRHSAKPKESYEVIERVSPGPRVEFFARRPRQGWDAFGNDPALVEGRAS